jgi:hypothetical protein
MTDQTASRQQRRHNARQKQKIQSRLTELVVADEVAGRGSVDDGAFFKRHPNRRYRMRPATPGEIETCALVTEPFVPDGDQFLWSLTKLLAPGMQARFFCACAPPDAPLDNIPERIAQEVFQQAAASGRMMEVIADKGIPEAVS